MATKKQLQSRLARRNLTVRSLATALSVSHVSIYHILHGRTTSRRIQAALEAVFDMPIADIRAAWANDPPAAVTPDALAQILRTAGISTEKPSAAGSHDRHAAKQKQHKNQRR